MNNSFELMLNVALLVRNILILVFYLGEAELKVLNNLFLCQLLASATLVPTSVYSRNPALVPTSASVTLIAAELSQNKPFVVDNYPIIAADLEQTPVDTDKPV